MFGMKTIATTTLEHRVTTQFAMPFFNRSSGGKENRTVSCILRTQDVLSPKHPMRLLHPTQTTKRENVFFVVFSLFGEFWRKKEVFLLLCQTCPSSAASCTPPFFLATKLCPPYSYLVPDWCSESTPPARLLVVLTFFPFLPPPTPLSSFSSHRLALSSIPRSSPSQSPNQTRTKFLGRLILK